MQKLSQHLGFKSVIFIKIKELIDGTIYLCLLYVNCTVACLTNKSIIIWIIFSEKNHAFNFISKSIDIEPTMTILNNTAVTKLYRIKCVQY